MDFETLRGYERLSLGSRPLEQQAKGARSQGARILGESQVCKAAEVSTPVRSNIGRKYLGSPEGSVGPKRDLAPCAAKAMMGRHNYGLTQGFPNFFGSSLP
jgi:hypothetical protein